MRAIGFQARVLVAYLRAWPSRADVDLALAMGAARNLDLDVQSAALEGLEASGMLKNVWLQVLESALPRAVEVARRHIDGLRDPEELRAAVLACLDSAVESAQRVGSETLANRPALLDDPVLWAALTESDDVVIQRMVAQEALARASFEPSGDFDRRVLVTRRQGRVAKMVL